MPKTAEEVKPNFGPVYAAALYPEWAQIFVSHGWALAVHGSLARDLDLVAIPWIESPSEPQTVLDEIMKKYAVTYIGEPTEKQHGRVAHTLSIGFGWCAVDLSFMPVIEVENDPT